jgi:hypothetical protein
MDSSEFLLTASQLKTKNSTLPTSAQHPAGPSASTNGPASVQSSYNVISPFSTGAPTMLPHSVHEPS